VITRRIAAFAANRYALSWILAVAFVLRVALVLATPHFKPAGDAADYDRVALSISRGHGYPDTNYAAAGTPADWRTPGYPGPLAAVYAIAGRQTWTAGRLLGAVLGVVTIALIFLLARELWDRRVALVAAAIAAVFPPLVMLNASLLSEALFVPLSLAALLAVLLYRRRGGALALAAAAGVLIGLAALTRSVGPVLLVPALLGVLAFGGRAVRARLAAGATVVLACALAIAPWAIRNARAYHEFVPLSTHGGLTAAGTYNRIAAKDGPIKGIWYPPFWVPEWRPLFLGKLDEAQIDKRLRRYARSYATGHPGYVAYVIGTNTLRLFDIGPGHSLSSRAWYGEMSVPRPARAPTSWSVWLLVAFGAAGLLILRASRVPIRAGPVFLWVAPLALWLSVVWVDGGVRFRAPLDPFIVLLAALVGVRLADGREALRLPSPRRRRVAATEA
jgi:hypothetical protein